MIIRVGLCLLRERIVRPSSTCVRPRKYLGTEATHHRVFEDMAKDELNVPVEMVRTEMQSLAARHDRLVHLVETDA